MRLWLQSSTLLAVVAGYSVLLLLNQRLAGLQRDLIHQQLVSQVQNELRSHPLSRDELLRFSNGLVAPGVRLTLLGRASSPPSPATPASGSALQDNWLSSTTDVMLTDGALMRLRVDQDVTASLQQEWLAFWLLVLAAGLSSLFTGLLLRLVLKRGLVQPLEAFSQQLEACSQQLTLIETPPSADCSIDLTNQPLEIQPIGMAFNALQQRLRSTWEQQRTFIDGVAHELRTPITLISGHTQSLLRRHEAAPLAPSLELIRREADQLGVLVSDLLDLARRDAGRLHLRSEALVAEDVLLEAHERLAARAEGRLQIAVNEAAAELIARADGERLQQCLAVLVDNALHYTAAPQSIRLSCSAGAHGAVVLHVRDHGPGVAEAERERIFERFVRGTVGLASAQRGSGLGLALVKLLIEAMGGSVRVTAAAGGGADFQLQLPGISASSPPA